MTHIVRQQYLHVELEGTEGDGLALQRSLPVLCRNWMTPAIEEVLDRFAPPDRHLSIERLEVDAGILSLEALDSRLAESVAQALEKSLRERLRPVTSPPAQVGEKSPRQVIDEAFVHFLVTGILPWSFRLPAGRSLEEVVLQSWQNGASPEGKFHITDRMLEALASSTARARLVRQFSPRFLKMMLALLSPPTGDAMEKMLQALTPLPFPSGVLTDLERTLVEVACARLAAGERVSEDLLLGDALRALPGTPLGDAVLAGELQRRWPEAIEPTPVITSTRQGEEDEGGEPSNGASRRAAPDNHPEAGDGIYVDNAGSVLLHPFLPAFFRAVEVAAGDNLLQPGRALCLLHLVATGQSIAPEYEVTLLKILCDIPPDAPVEADAALTAFEKEEADALLRAVIGHWEALRSTSPDGLRGSFLLRPGKLSLRDGDWLLQVEPQTCDILLDQLPWGLSMIKLPWMERMLWVEWR